MRAQAESTPCRVRTAIAAYFDRRIAATTKRAEHAENETVKELSRTLLARHLRNKGDVLATHFKECRICEGGINEDNPPGPIRCRAYQAISEFMGRDVANCVERVKAAKSETLRTSAETELDNTKMMKERFLHSHLGRCKECT